MSIPIDNNMSLYFICTTINIAVLVLLLNALLFLSNQICHMQVQIIPLVCLVFSFLFLGNPICLVIF